MCVTSDVKKKKKKKKAFCFRMDVGNYLHLGSPNDALRIYMRSEIFQLLSYN